MRKAYTYTLPEEFIKDPDVPVRWKIYATLTGFWIKGLTFYATNDWLEKELKSSKRAIQYGLSDLEKMDLINRNVNGMSRLILPGGCNPLHGGVQSKGQKGCNQLHHNSDSNSDNLNDDFKSKSSSSFEDSEISNTTEISRVPQTEDGILREAPVKGGRNPSDLAKNALLKKIWFRFCTMCREELQTEPVGAFRAFPKSYVAINFAMNSGKLSEAQIYDLFEQWFSQRKSEESLISINAALSAANINKYKTSSR